MRTLTIAEQLERFGRSMAQHIDPFAVVDRGEDHTPARLTPGEQVQILNHRIAFVARENTDD